MIDRPARYRPRGLSLRAGLKSRLSFDLRGQPRARGRCGCVTSVHKHVCLLRLALHKPAPLSCSHGNQHTSTAAGRNGPRWKSSHLGRRSFRPHQAFPRRRRRRTDGCRLRRREKEPVPQNAGSPPPGLRGWGRGSNLLPSNSSRAFVERSAET